MWKISDIYLQTRSPVDTVVTSDPEKPGCDQINPRFDADEDN